jgi:hypothetical protein
MPPTHNLLSGLRDPVTNIYVRRARLSFPEAAVWAGSDRLIAASGKVKSQYRMCTMPDLSPATHTIPGADSDSPLPIEAERVSAYALAVRRLKRSFSRGAQLTTAAGPQPWRRATGCWHAGPAHRWEASLMASWYAILLEKPDTVDNRRAFYRRARMRARSKTQNFTTERTENT